MQKQSRQNTQTAFYSPQPGIYSPTPFRMISSPGGGGPRNSQNFLLDSYTTKHQDLESDRLMGSSLRFTMLKDGQQHLQNEISVLKTNLLQSRMSGDNLQFNTQPLEKLLRRIDDNGNRKTEQIRYDPPMTYRSDDLLSEMLSELSVISVNAKKLQHQRSSSKLQMLVVKDIREIILGWNKLHNIVNQVCQATQLSMHQLQSTNIPSLFHKDDINKLNALVENYQNIYPQSFDQLYQIIQSSLQMKEQDYNKILEMNAQLRQSELTNKELNTKTKNLFAVITKLEAKVNKLAAQKTQLELANKNYQNQLQKYQCDSKVYKSQELFTENDKLKSEVNKRNQIIESQSSLDSRNNHKQLEIQFSQLQEQLIEKETEVIELKMKNDSQKEEYEELIKEHSSKVKQIENENKQMKVQMSKALENEKQLQRLNQEIHIEHNQWKEEQGKKIKLLNQEINDLKIQQNKQKNREDQQEYEQQQLQSVKSQLSSIKQAKDESEREYSQLQQKFQALKQVHQELSDQHERDQQMNKQIIQQLQSQYDELECRQVQGNLGSIQDDFRSQQEFETQQQLIKQLELELKQAQTAYRDQQVNCQQHEDEINLLHKKLAKIEKEHQEQIHILDNTIQSKDHIIQQYESNSRILNDTPEQLRSKSVEQSTIQGHLKSQIDSLNKSITHYEQQLKELTRAHMEAQEQVSNRDKVIKKKNQELSYLEQSMKDYQGINSKVQQQERIIANLEKQAQTLHSTISKNQESLRFKDEMIEAKQHEISILQTLKKDNATQLKQQAQIFEQSVQKLKNEQQEQYNQTKHIKEELMENIKEKKEILDQLQVCEDRNTGLIQQQLKLQNQIQTEKLYYSEKISQLNSELKESENEKQELRQRILGFENQLDKQNEKNSELIFMQEQIQDYENNINQLETEINKERANFMKELQLKIEEINAQLENNQELVTKITELTQQNLNLKERLESMSKDWSELQQNLLKEVEDLKNNEITRNYTLQENIQLITDYKMQIELLNNYNQSLVQEGISIKGQLEDAMEENKRLTKLNAESQQALDDIKTQLELEIVSKEAKIVRVKKSNSEEQHNLCQQLGNVIDQNLRLNQEIEALNEQVSQKKMEQQLQQNIEIELSNAQKRIVSLAEQLEQSDNRTQNLFNELHEKNLEVQTVNLQLQIAQQEIESQQLQLVTQNQQIDLYQKETISYKEKQEKLLFELHQQVQQISAQNQNLLQVIKNQEIDINKKGDGFKNQINQLEQEIEIDKDLNSELKNNKIKLEEQLVQSQTEKEQLNKEVNDLKNAILLLQQENDLKEQKQLDELHSAQQGMQQVQIDLKQFKDEQQHLLSKQQMLQNQIIEQQQKLQELQIELSAKTKLLSEVEQQLKQHKLHIVQDQENIQQLKLKYDGLLEKINQQNLEIIELKTKNSDLIDSQISITNKIEAENAQNKLINSQQEQIKHLEQKIHHLEQDIQQHQDEIQLQIAQQQEQDQQNLIAQNQESINQVQLLEQKENNIQQQQEQIKDLVAQNQQQQIENKQITQKLNNLTQEHNEQISQNKQLVDQISLSLQQILEQDNLLKQQISQYERLENDYQTMKDQMNDQLENLNSQITGLLTQLDSVKQQFLEKEQQVNKFISREDEAMKLFAAKDSEILALQNELEAKHISVDRSSVDEHQNTQIVNQIKQLFGQENILDFLRQFKSQHEKQCERRLVFFKCLQSLFDEYLRNLPAAYYTQNFVNLSQQEQNDLSTYSKDIQLMKAKLPVKTVLTNIREEKEEDLSFGSNEKLPDNQEKDMSDFIDGLNISEIVKDKKENSTSKQQQLSHTEEVNILKYKLEASNEENLKIIGKFQTLLERLASKEEEIQKLNQLAREYKHKLMAMQKTAVDPQAVHAKAHLKDCLRKFLVVCGPKVQNYDLGEAILNTLFQFLEFAEKDKEDLLEELALKPIDKKKGVVQILFKK